MAEELHEAALLLAASEIVPGEGRDLSELLETAALTDLLAGHGSSVVPPLVEHLREHLPAERISAWERRLADVRARHPQLRLVTVRDADYPANLRRSYDRPPFLFVDGSLSPTDQRAVAVVGSRTADPAGLADAEAIASTLAAHHYTVVAGLALGVDTRAHTAAIRAGGRSLAVLGTGIDRITPESNHELAGELRAQGALISQFRPGAPPTRTTFLIRNAVISALSLASVIVAAAERSGTRSEAEHSLRQGRPVLLWRPQLGDQAWARQFAKQPGVHLVADVAELLDIVAAQDPPEVAQAL